MSQTRSLYQLQDGTFVRTQGEIPKGDPVNKVEVPVDSKGLCGYLNGLIVFEREVVLPPMPLEYFETNFPKGSPTIDQTAPSSPGGITMTDVEGFIQGADAARLALITQNACYRMMELMKGLT